MGPHHLDGTCDSPGARDGRPWPVRHLLHQLYLMCMPTSHTHPMVPGPLPILGTTGGVSWGPEVVSGNSGEPEKLEVCALGFWSPSLCWFPSIKPQALTQSRGWGRSHIPGLRALPALWRAPSLDLVLTSHHGGFFFLLSPLPHPAESAFSRRVEGKAQNHFEETNSSSQNSSGELVCGVPWDRRPVLPGSLWSVLG